MRPDEVLRLARDVPGVAGSCLVDGDGRVLVRDLPPDIDDALLSAVAGRAQAALGAIGGPLPGAVGAALRFDRLSVFCGRAGDNTLLILCTPETSTPSIKATMQASAHALAHVTEPVAAASNSSGTPARPRKRGSGIWG